MRLSIGLLLFVVVPLKEVISQGSTCANPQIESRCIKKNCKPIPRVQDTVIKWNEVTPTSFVTRWKPQKGAKCYFISLLRGYTVHVMQNITCTSKIKYEFGGLRPAQIYGVQVSVVDRKCKRGRPGIPARTRTLWAPTTPPPTITYPTLTPEPRECGLDMFTCHSNTSECVPNKKWCDKRLDCVDISDERGCPGGCEELEENFKNGNFSCTRFGSPGSVCNFECKEPYERDGPKYIQCSKRRKKWTHQIPTCRLAAPRSLKVLSEEATNTTITVEWEPVEGAKRYTFLAIEQTDSFEMALMRMKSVDSKECCKAMITNLKPASEFMIILNAVDDSDVDGLKSSPVFGRTAEESAVHEEKEDTHDDEPEKDGSGNGTNPA